jgi:hypothetical protein
MESLPGGSRKAELKINCIQIKPTTRRIYEIIREYIALHYTGESKLKEVQKYILALC